MRKFYGIIVLLTALLFTFSAGAYPDNEPASLDLIIEEAVKNNPRIKAAHKTWEAAFHKAKEALGLPDPTASYSYFGESVETRVGPQQHKYAISQTIPFPVKIGLKNIAEARHADMLKERFEATRREIIKEVKFVYYDLFWVDKAIEVTEEEKAIIEKLEKTAQRKYESNIVPIQDAIKAQVELSRLIDKLFLLRQNRKSLEAKMNALLNRPAEMRIAQTDGIREIRFKHGLDELHIIAANTSQELLGARLNVERAQYEKSLAQMDYVPDITLGFDYIQVGKGYTMQPNDGQDAWLGTVKINIPVWLDRIEEKVKSKKAALESSRESYQDTENMVYYEIEDLYFKVKAYEDIVSLYETALVPQTEQAFEAARTAYEAGQVDFLNWLDSERVLLQTKLAYYKAITDYSKSVAFLERIIGQDL